MKRILVTRPADQGREFGDALQRAGLEPMYAPMIEIVPTNDWTATDTALQAIDEYDALVFTSVNGVRFFVERMSRTGRNCDEMPAAFGVGKRTKATIVDCGLTLIPTDDTMTAEGLAGEICTYLSGAGFQGVEGMRFLFPCGDKAREELPDALRTHGAIVDPIIVYVNRPVSSASSAQIIAAVDRGEIAAAAFFSPSQVDAFLAFFPTLIADHRASLVIAAIGETTAGALRQVKIIPDVVSSSPDATTFATEIAAAVHA